MKIKIWQISIYFLSKLKIVDPCRKNKLDYEDKGYYYKLKAYEPNIKQDQYHARTPLISLKPPAARFPLQFARLCSTLSCRFNLTIHSRNSSIESSNSALLPELGATSLPSLHGLFFFFVISGSARLLLRPLSDCIFQLRNLGGGWCAFGANWAGFEQFFEPADRLLCWGAAKFVAYCWASINFGECFNMWIIVKLCLSIMNFGDSVFVSMDCQWNCVLSIIMFGIRVAISSAHYMLDKMPDSDGLVLNEIVCFFWGVGVFCTVFTDGETEQDMKRVLLVAEVGDVFKKH